MPEKVHTRFGDENVLPRSELEIIKKTNKKGVRSGTAPSKKRRASEAFRGGNPQTVTFNDRAANGAVGDNVGHASPSSSTSGGKSLSSLKKRAVDLLPNRNALPISSHRDEICTQLRGKDLLLLVGETGSGKSTQVPQFLLHEPWCKPQNIVLAGNAVSAHGGDARTTRVRVGGCIAITQPRRVAAISLARRVAEEMGTPLGKSSPASQVGYSVRFDTSTSPSTKIKFLTEGMLLQEMLRDPWLREYSVVIVDEVHERGVNVDLLLGFLKRLTGGRQEGRGAIPIKAVVMSATAEMEKIQQFFEAVDENQPASTVDGAYAPSETDSEWSGISEGDKPGRTRHRENRSISSSGAAGSNDPQVAVCRIEGRQYPVKTVYSPGAVSDVLDAALERIFQIHLHEPLPGDILVFLTGQETVENLESLCHERALSLDFRYIPKLLILPLFAALPQSAQQQVFESPPPRTRKVIIATNIAETSVTVPGVRFVIDSGKCKKKHFRSRLGLDSLLVKAISKSAANQRKGRAGREAPGTCYRLYTEESYLSLHQDNDPEILRCDLTQMVLGLKARDVEDVVNFPFLTPPTRDALERALLHLLRLKAIDETGQISLLGVQIARLPISPGLARVLLAAAQPEHNCLDQCVDIISALSAENVFLNTSTEEKKEEADSARRDLYRREGDHLTLLATVQAYASENADRKAWCEKRLVSHRAMQAVMDVRKQLAVQSKSLLADGASTVSSSKDDMELPARILKAFLTGFATNTARLMPDGTYKTVVGNQLVAIHPSSVLFARKVEAIMYNEFVFTQKSYARGVSAVQLNWIGAMFS